MSMKACSLMWCGLLVDTYPPDSRNQRGMDIMDWMLFYLLLNMICWSPIVGQVSPMLIYSSNRSTLCEAVAQPRATTVTLEAVFNSHNSQVI